MGKLSPEQNYDSSFDAVLKKHTQKNIKEEGFLS